ncbi:MAG: PadR family transcriptional regulator [Pseudomonadota bacterium]
MKLESWKSQLRKGAAELALLSLLGRDALSGTELLDRMADYSKIGLSDGTIYPLLKRLEREGRIAGDWKLPTGTGRPTKHYSLTEDGRIALAQMQQTWSVFRQELTALLGDPQ